MRTHRWPYGPCFYNFSFFLPKELLLVADAVAAEEAAKSSSTRLYNSFPMAMTTFTGIPNMHLYSIVYSSFIGPQDGVKMKTDWKKKVLLFQSINE